MNVELDKARISAAKAVIVVGTRGELPQQADAITIPQPALARAEEADAGDDGDDAT